MSISVYLSKVTGISNNNTEVEVVLQHMSEYCPNIMEMTGVLNDLKRQYFPNTQLWKWESDLSNFIDQKVVKIVLEYDLKMKKYETQSIIELTRFKKEEIYPKCNLVMCMGENKIIIHCADDESYTTYKKNPRIRNLFDRIQVKVFGDIYCAKLVKDPLAIKCNKHYIVCMDMFYHQQYVVTECEAQQSQEIIFKKFTGEKTLVIKKPTLETNLSSTIEERIMATTTS